MRSRPIFTTLLLVGMLALVGAGAITYAIHGIAPSVSGSRAPVSSTATTATTATTVATLPGLSPGVASVEWTLLWFTRQGTDAADWPPITLRMEREDASVSGSSGCNTYRGTYVAEGVALRLRLTGFTQRVCATPIMAREQAYLQALGTVEAYGWEPGDLMLANSNVQTILEFHGIPARTDAPTPSATPTAPLQPGVAGRTWSLVRFTQDGRDYPGEASHLVTLWLDPQGARVGGHATCNIGYGGTHVASGATLRLRVGFSDDRVVYTRMVCGDVASMLLGFEYSDVLWLVETYRLEAGQLVLASAGGRLQLTFQALPCDKPGSSGGRLAATTLLSGTPWPVTPTPTPCPSA
jgi:heat shock protein HslJ